MATAHGADWVEFDVRRSRDGILVVCHDPSPPGGGIIAELDRADIPDTVPDLADAVTACGALGVNIEIKNDPREPGYDPSGSLARAVVEAWDGLARAGARNDVLITSFDQATVEVVRSLHGAPDTGLLTWGPVEPAERCAAIAAAGHVAINPDDGSCDQALVEAAHRAGLHVNVWTVDDPDRLRQLAELGVDGLITNHPSLGREVIDAR